MANDASTFGVWVHAWKTILLVLFSLVTIVMAYPWHLPLASRHLVARQVVFTRSRGNQGRWSAEGRRGQRGLVLTAENLATESDRVIPGS